MEGSFPWGKLKLFKGNSLGWKFLRIGKQMLKVLEIIDWNYITIKDHSETEGRKWKMLERTKGENHFLRNKLLVAAISADARWITFVSKFEAWAIFHITLRFFTSAVSLRPLGKLLNSWNGINGPMCQLPIARQIINFIKIKVIGSVMRRISKELVKKIIILMVFLN